MGPRKRVFTDERMDEFKFIHQQSFGVDTPTPKMGYPDMGAGYYSKRIPYKDWWDFNCAQRIHGNSLEHLSWALPMMMVTGVFQPTLTAALGCVILGGRELYRYGYTQKEGAANKLRVAGSIPLNVAEQVMILSFCCIWSKHKYEGAFKNRKFIQRFIGCKQNAEMKKLLKEDKDKLAPLRVYN